MPDILDPMHWLWLLLFCSGVFVVVYIMRTVLEGFFPKLAANYDWRNIALPTIPIVVGILMSFPWVFPAEISNTTMRVILGACGGYASGWTVRIVKALIKRASGVDLTKDENDKSSVESDK